MTTDLSPRQQAIIDFILSELHSKGYPPSVREIGKAVGLRSSSTVHGHLDYLEDRGYIRRDPTKPRAIEVLYGKPAPHLTKEMVQVPIVGQVTAGQPILAVENIEDTFPLPVEFTGRDNVFILTVKGDSMQNAGILDGDYVLVRQQNTAHNGEIVVALIGEEATVKRFYLEKGQIRLQPENETYKPIFSTDAVILGKVTGVFRRIH